MEQKLPLLDRTKAIIERFGVDDVERFQRAFPDTIVSAMIEELLAEEKMFWHQWLTDMTASDTLTRQAQGGHEAVKRLWTVITQLLAYVAPKAGEEDDQEEEELEDGNTNIVF